MSWTWRYEDAQGAPAVATSAGELPRDTFPTQADAETWIGEAWRDLLDRGVHAVSLLDDGRVVYGPMSLHPAS